MSKSVSMKKNDYLNCKANCQCTACNSVQQIFEPEIYQDYDMYQLKKQSKSSTTLKLDFISFLQQLKKAEQSLPQFPILDTIKLKNGEVQFCFYYDKNKMNILKSIPSLRNFIYERKMKSDLQYQKKKYMRMNAGFTFTQLDHQSQKVIKDFQLNIKYISSLLNRVAIIKFKGKQQQDILCMQQLKNLFDKGKAKAHDLKDIQYIQIFPIMTNEQQYSYTKEIKYFRNRQCLKPNFKLAQHFFSSWYQKNETQDKLQQQVIEKIKESQENLLMYFCYKIMIHFQYVSNIRVESACIEFITNDQGHSFYMKNIKFINAHKLQHIQTIKAKKPTKKSYEPDEYFELSTEMKKIFQNYQLQYHRLEMQQQQHTKKLVGDKEYSNKVYQTITGNTEKNLHEVLLSPSKNYRKEHLRLQ